MIADEWAVREVSLDDRPYQSIVVHFRDERSVAEFARLIGQSITPASRFVWFKGEKG